MCFVGECLYHKLAKQAGLEAVSSLWWSYDTSLLHNGCKDYIGQKTPLWAEEEHPGTSFPVPDPMYFMSKTSDSKNWVKDLGEKKKKITSWS